MILTFIYPHRGQYSDYEVELKIYPDDKIDEAEKDLFNRLHERWADRGQTWLTNGSEFDTDRILLKTWGHIIGSNHDVVMVIDLKGETE